MILSKILFKEFYDVDVKTSLLKNGINSADRNILIVGDENYEKELFLKALSFAEEIIELIGAPYVNFVFAGNSETELKKFASECKSNLAFGHVEEFNNLFPALPQTSLDFIKLNIQHLVFDFDEQDLEGIKLLLQMPYYYGLIKDMVDVKLV